MNYRYAILSAVSTKTQQKTTSIDDQLSACRKLAQQGWRETAGPYIVRGQSRQQYLNLRDAEAEIIEIHNLLEDARNGEYDILVVYDHDRLRDLLTLVYGALSNYRVQLFSVSAQNTPVPPDQYDPYENDTNDLLISINQIKSKTENARLRRKYRVGMRNRILVHHLPAQIPYGYSKPLGDAHNHKAVPVQIESLIPHLIEIKNRFLRGQSLAQLVEYLEENRIPPPRAKHWHPQTVRAILANPFYAGIVQFEKTKVRKDRRYNRKTRDRNIPTSQVIAADGLHEPIWDNATHIAIINELARRRKNYRGRQNNQFTGLPQCGECGSSMWRFKNGPRSVFDRIIWRCSQNPAEHPTITHISLTQRVGEILKQTLQPHLEKKETTEVKKQPALKQNPTAELETERSRIERAYIKGMLSEDKFEKYTTEIDEKLRNIRNETATQRNIVEQRQRIQKELRSTLGKQAQHIPAWLEGNDPSETNRILHLLLENITVHRKNIELNYRE